MKQDLKPGLALKKSRTGKFILLSMCGEVHGHKLHQIFNVNATTTQRTLKALHQIDLLAVRPVKKGYTGMKMYGFKYDSNFVIDAVIKNNFSGSRELENIIRSIMVTDSFKLDFLSSLEDAFEKLMRLGMAGYEEGNIKKFDVLFDKTFKSGNDFFNRVVSIAALSALTLFITATVEYTTDLDELILGQDDDILKNLVTG